LSTIPNLDDLILSAAHAIAAEGRSPNNNRVYWRLLDTHRPAYQDVKQVRRRLLEAGLLPQPAPRIEVAH
jgi:hypothetical protein